MKTSIKQKLALAKISKFPLNDMGFIPVIPWKMIEDVFGKKEYGNFIRWMDGQTCSPYGVYPNDMENYIRGNKPFD